MQRRSDIYLRDILDAIRRIEGYTAHLDEEDFSSTPLIVDAVLRNLEVIGEAVKHIPQSFKDRYPDIEWRKYAGLRDVLIHEYYGVNLHIIWDIMKNKLPAFKGALEKTSGTFSKTL